MNLSFINFMWILFNFPFLFLLYIHLVDKQNLFLIRLLTIFCIPFIFFPATTAMFACVRQCVIRSDNNASIKMYVKFFLEDYKISMLVGMIYTTLWLIWGMSIYMSILENHSIFIVVMLITGLVNFVLTINTFIVSVHYHHGLMEVIKHSIMITFGSPLLFIYIVISAIFIVSISIIISRLVFTLFIVCFTGSLFVCIIFSFFYRQYQKFRHHGV